MRSDRVARDRNSINNFDGTRGQVDPRVVIGIGVAALILLAVIFLVARKTEPVSEPIPAPERPLETVEPAESPEDRGDTAREIIDKLAGNDEGPEEAYRRAREFQAENRLADAQLLYFYAARSGHGPAAFDLATAYDPIHAESDSSLMGTSDPAQAYRWYRVARDAGQEAATGRLQALHEWTEVAAADGDVAAEQLLLRWEIDDDE